MANLRGDEFLVQVSTDSTDGDDGTWTTVGCQADTGISVEGTPIEAVCKNGGSWSDQSISKLAWTANFTANIDPTHTQGARQFFTAMTDKTVLYYRWLQVDVDGDAVVGGPVWSGRGAISNWAPSFPGEGYSTYTVNVLGKGELVQGTVSS